MPETLERAELTRLLLKLKLEGLTSLRLSDSQVSNAQGLGASACRHTPYGFTPYGFTPYGFAFVLLACGLAVWRFGVEPSALRREPWGGWKFWAQKFGKYA